MVLTNGKEASIQHFERTYEDNFYESLMNIMTIHSALTTPCSQTSGKKCVGLSEREIFIITTS